MNIFGILFNALETFRLRRRILTVLRKVFHLYRQRIVPRSTQWLFFPSQPKTFPFPRLFLCRLCLFSSLGSPENFSKGSCSRHITLLLTQEYLGFDLSHDSSCDLFMYVGD